MRIMLATLVLNEMEWLPKLVKQHLDWPGLCCWAFVEAADRRYAEANPGLATGDGLSTDGTTDYLRTLGSPAFRHDKTIKIIHHGWADHADPAQAKCQARNRYLELADEVKPDAIVVLDADEFWTWDGQRRLNDLLDGRRDAGLMLPTRHIWRPYAMPASELFRWEVQGGYWSVPHARVWRWRPGLRHTDNHNVPHGVRVKRMLQPGMPETIHLGFASANASRAAKRRYYGARGEGVSDRRGMYQDCRLAYENWSFKDKLPHGAEVVPYVGNIPEAFL